jgi:hypothetical protein
MQADVGQNMSFSFYCLLIVLISFNVWDFGFKVVIPCLFVFFGQIKVLLEYFHLSIRFYGALRLASKSEKKFCLVFLFFRVSSGSLSNPRRCSVFILLVAIKAIQFFINNI